MRLETTQLPLNKHSQIVTGVGWTPQNTLYTVGDDKEVWKWDMSGQPISKVCDLDQFPTAVQWCLPPSSNGVANADTFAVACSNGEFKLISKIGKTEKTVRAHQGAVTALAWSHDGAALATAGEDGLLKQWSRSGNLRSKLATSDRAIYCVAWKADNQAVLYSSGRTLSVKPLAANTKATKWKAHDGVVLCVSWDTTTGHIVSGGEDCRYKVWSDTGRLLYVSSPNEFAITSVAWAPGGDRFGVGSFNSVTLCDNSGWAHSRAATSSGSVMSIDWTVDGTHLAAAGASGAVVFGSIVDRTVEASNYTLTLNENNQIIVSNVLAPAATDTLDFSGRVIDFQMRYDRVVVSTDKACYVYSTSNFVSPHVFDLQGAVSLCLQSSDVFLLVDNARGCRVFSYDGRTVSQLSASFLAPSNLKRGVVALSNDVIAVVDGHDRKKIHFVDVTSGRKAAEPLTHDLDVVFVALSQKGSISERKIAFVDDNW